jgi:hypothetical protein
MDSILEIDLLHQVRPTTQRSEAPARPGIRQTTRFQHLSCRPYGAVDESVIRDRTSAIGPAVGRLPHFQCAGRIHALAADEVIKGKLERFGVEA